MPKANALSSQLLPIALVLVILFGVILLGLTQYSFWLDEGFSAWIVQDSMRDPGTLRESLRFVRDSILNTLQHTQEDVHPPLYYLVLDVWTLIAGRSEFSFRYPSALLGMIALASTFAVTRRLFDLRTGIIALVILGTSGFFLYYAREARMYSLYLALTTLAMWIYSRWWHRPTLIHTGLLTLTMTLLLYTHYTSILIIVAIVIHSLVTVRKWFSLKSLFYLLAVTGISSGLFALWIPSFMRQLDIHTGFIAPGAIPSDWGTAAAIWLKLTNGYGWLYAPILLLSAAWLRLHKNIGGLLLILLWGIAPVLGLFLINAQGLSILQLRYLIPVIAAWSILVAYVIAGLRVPYLNQPTANNVLVIVATGAIVFTQWASYSVQWSPKPDWRGVVTDASNTRNVTDPALVYLDPQSPFAYYAEQTSLLDGISIDIGWREFAPQEIWEIASALDEQPVVWGMGQMQAPESWDAIAAISQNRGVTYRKANQATVFYQFDVNATDDLLFEFGSSHETRLFTYTGDFYTRQSAQAGEDVCIDVELETQSSITEPYALIVSLTRGYNEVIAQITESIGTPATGDNITREFCFTKPDDDDFHLRLSIYNEITQQHLFLLENDYYWGGYLMLGTAGQQPADTP